MHCVGQKLRVSNNIFVDAFVAILLAVVIDHVFTEQANYIP